MRLLIEIDTFQNNDECVKTDEKCVDLRDIEGFFESQAYLKSFWEIFTSIKTHLIFAQA